MPKNKDPFSFNFGANAVRKPSGGAAKKKGSGGKSRSRSRTKYGRPKGGSIFGS